MPKNNLPKRTSSKEGSFDNPEIMGTPLMGASSWPINNRVHTDNNDDTEEVESKTTRGFGTIYLNCLRGERKKMVKELGLHTPTVTGVEILSKCFIYISSHRTRHGPEVVREITSSQIFGSTVNEHLSNKLRSEEIVETEHSFS